MKPLQVLARLDWWLVLLAATLSGLGLLYLRSATQTEFEGRHLRQAGFLALGVGTGAILILLPYARVLRGAWPIYGAVLLALVLLPWFGADPRNGARRWYSVGGFSLQPAEFAKLALILVLASWLRFRAKAATFEGLVVPVLLALVPGVLILRQPNLSSFLVLWPILLAMCWAAGTPGRTLLGLVAVGLAVLVAGYFFFLHGYQSERIDTWLAHFTWADWDQREARAAFLDAGLQPMNSLIAIGSGGWTGAGLGQGPQNVYGFLPYRSEDYIFAVVCEETGLLGALTVLGLLAGIVFACLRAAFLVRERFGRLVCVGVAAWLATQGLVHAYVCAWLLPSTGQPLPLVSYGGSAILVVCLGLALVLNIGARREPVLGGEAFL
ncbi:MAG: FtsW/RodA/SpoVE family cell cycle protein [Planctomycetes bacterium]|nr:FtsW/RodA/SpoVE family cell cycle protein [Planctomycetota bacterium]